MKVICMTSDKYLWAVRPFAWLFNKYWSPKQEVVVSGFTPPAFELPSNFTFLSVGKFEDYPVSKWSDALIRTLELVGEDTFVLMLEDYWLTRGVNTEAVAMADGYVRQFGYVLRVDLTTDRLFSSGPHYPNEIEDYGHCGYLDLLRTPVNTPYQMSLMPGVWRRDRMLEILIPGETPWDIEINGSRRVDEQNDKMIVLGTRQWPVRIALGMRGGDHMKVDTSGLQPVDKDELGRLGYLQPV